MRDRKASPHTIASYSDTFRLLLGFAREHLKKDPSSLAIEDMTAPLILAFLDSLEKKRGNTARSRNVRLAAIRSFFRYAAYRQPEQSALIQRVLSIPSKRYERAPIDFLAQPEVDALLSSPDLSTWAGRRDRALILLAIQTGLRVSELSGLRCEDVVLGWGAHVRCMGKGRKERCTPLLKDVTAVMRSWLAERRGEASEPLFPNARGGALSPDGVAYVLGRHVKAARRVCPSLVRKRVSPHVLRHTTAMRLLQSGVDLATIALVLGHYVASSVM